VKGAAKEEAVVTSGDDTLARYADTARLAGDIARHMRLGRLTALATYLPQAY